MRFLIPCILITLAMAPSSFATDDTPQKKIRTFIKPSTCEQVIADIEKRQDYKPLAVIVGSFVSGSNHAKQRYSLMGLKNMLVVTEKFCRDHPEKPFVASLANLDQVIDRQIRLEAAKNQ